MILVTGAAGKTGRAVINALAQRGARVRALIHNREQRSHVVQAGARQTVPGDMTRPEIWQQALQGVQAVYHVAPNVHPQEAEIGRAAIDAAVAAGVEQFVYHSVLHPQAEAMPHHWQKLRVEEALLTAGLPFTILQPCAYMQNLAAQWTAITEQGEYSVPYGVETRLSLVDLEDVAQVAARMLTEPGHEGATYELVGTPPLSQREVAAIFAQVLGRPVQARTIPLDEWTARAQEAGRPPYAVETLQQMFRYYDRHGFGGNPRVLTYLLGRSPRTLENFAQRLLQEEAVPEAEAE